MRPVYTTPLGAVGFTDWVPVSYRSAASFQVAIAVTITSGASLTYTVEHTLDDLWAVTDIWSAARSTTTLTVTKANHGLTAGDWNQFDAPSAAPALGQYSVATVTNANVYTITVANSGATTFASGTANIHTARVLPHSSLVTKTVSADGNYAFPPRAVRLSVTIWASGTAQMAVIQTS